MARGSGRIPSAIKMDTSRPQGPLERSNQQPSTRLRQNGEKLEGGRIGQAPYYLSSQRPSRLRSGSCKLAKTSCSLQLSEPNRDLFRRQARPGWQHSRSTRRSNVTVAETICGASQSSDTKKSHFNHKNADPSQELKPRR